MMFIYVLLCKEDARKMRVVGGGTHNHGTRIIVLGGKYVSENEENI